MKKMRVRKMNFTTLEGMLSAQMKKVEQINV